MSRPRVDSPQTSAPEPNEALALVHQGWHELQLQRPLAAWASWQRALRVEPEFEAATRALETLESAIDLPISARVAYKFRAPRDPERRARWDAQLRGKNLEQLDAASDAFAAILHDDPSDADAWYNRALCLAWLGRNGEAVSCLEHVVRLQAPDRFEDAVNAWTLAEILRQGAGAEALADDYRYSCVFDWDDRQTEALVARVPELQAVPAVRNPTTGEPQFPGIRAFEWLDRPPLNSDDDSPRTVDDLPLRLATVVATSNALRLSSPDPETLERAETRLIEVVGEDLPEPRREATPLPLPLLDAAVWSFRPPQGLDPSVEAQLSRGMVEHYFEDVWIHLHRKGLDGRSPLDAGREASAGDLAARARLAAVVQVREQLGARPRSAPQYHGYPFDRLRRRLGLELTDPAAVDPEDASCMSGEELDRLDAEALPLEVVIEAYRSAVGLRDDRRAARFAAAIVGRDAGLNADVVAPPLFAILVRDALRANDPGKALDWLQKARETHGGRDRRTYDIWSAEVHTRTGNPDAALDAYRGLLEDADVPSALLLDAAEELLNHGYVDHAGPFLERATERARIEEDPAALARASALSGEL